MNWDKLKLFYFVAREKSISQAAKRLNVTPSALSKQITNLEKELGFKLFNRHLRGVELTPQGKAFFPELEEINFKIKQICSDSFFDKEGAFSSLSIAADSGFVDTWLGERLPVFLKQTPQVYLNVKSCNTALDLNKEGFDLAITTQIVSSPLVEKKVLMSWQRKLYASPNYIAQHGMPKSFDDLDNHRLISFGEDSMFPLEDMDWHLKAGKDGEVRQPYLTINSMGALVRAAEQDVGIMSFSEESTLLEGANLINVLPDVYGPKINLYVACRKGMWDSPVIKNFMTFLHDAVKESRK